MNRYFYNIQIRVLICPEDGEFVARALEMDLLGYGKTEREAIEELKSAIESQISFAHQMNDPGMIQFPADQSYFKRWEDAQIKALRHEILEDKPMRLESRAAIISFNEGELKSLREKRFQKTQLVCA